MHPILLDWTHRLAKLIIAGAHLRVRHNGVKETLSEVHGMASFGSSREDAW